MENEKSMLDITYDYLREKSTPTPLQDIWNHVCEVLGYDEETSKRNIAKFYTNLTLDGRFVTLGENTWDLRTNHTFDKVHIDMNDVYHDVESESELDEEEIEEEQLAYQEGILSEGGDSIVVDEQEESKSSEVDYEKAPNRDAY